MTQAEKEQENGKEKEKERDKEKEKEQQRGVKRPIAPAAIPETLQEVRLKYELKRFRTWNVLVLTPQNYFTLSGYHHQSRWSISWALTPFSKHKIKILENYHV